MKYAKVKQGTEQWKKFDRYWNQEANWIKNKDKIEQLIGCTMAGNLIVDNKQLSMDEPPEHLKSQFSNQRKHCYFNAKKNSKINKAWIEFAQEHELDTYDRTDFLLEVGLLFQHHKPRQLHPNMFGDYYVAFEEQIPQGERYDWLEEVDEPTFLRLLANFKEQEVVA